MFIWSWLNLLNGDFLENIILESLCYDIGCDDGAYDVVYVDEL